MPPRHWRLRIEDILESIQRIQEFTKDVSFDDYLSDVQLRLAVERCFEIIGEASRHIPAEVEARHSDVPWRRMRDMRNVISHVYFKVSSRIVWDTLKQDLPPLVPKLRAVLEDELEDDGG